MPARRNQSGQFVPHGRRHQPPPAPLGPRLCVPPPLAAGCCLRCSKQLAEHPDLECRRPSPSHACDWCRQKGKKCFYIPHAFRPRFAACQALARALPACTDEGYDDACSALDDAVAEYTRKVEAYGRTHGEITAGNAPLRLAAAAEKIAASLDNLLDAVRYIAGLPELPPADDEDDFVGDLMDQGEDDNGSAV